MTGTTKITIFVIAIIMVGISFFGVISNNNLNVKSPDNNVIAYTSNECSIRYAGLCEAQSNVNGNCVATYVTAYCITFADGQPAQIAYFFENQLSGGQGHIVLGSWSNAKSASYSNSPISSNNLPSTWALNPNSISRCAQPNNMISWGSSTSTTTSTSVTWGVTGSVTYGGIGTSATYGVSNGVSRTFTTYQFCMKPTAVEADNLAWYYQDNAGVPAATTYTLTEIQTNSYNYQHIFYDVNGKFWDNNWNPWFDHYNPVTDVQVGGGFTYEV